MHKTWWVFLVIFYVVWWRPIRGHQSRAEHWELESVQLLSSQWSVVLSSPDQLVFIPPSFTQSSLLAGGGRWRNYRNTQTGSNLSLSLSLLTLPSATTGKHTDIRHAVQHNNNRPGQPRTRSWSPSYRDFSFYQLTSGSPGSICRSRMPDCWLFHTAFTKYISL